MNDIEAYRLANASRLFTSFHLIDHNTQDDTSCTWGTQYNMCTDEDVLYFVQLARYVYPQRPTLYLISSAELSSFAA